MLGHCGLSSASEHSGPENEGVVLLRHSLRLLPVLVLALVGVFALSAAGPAPGRERPLHPHRGVPADGGRWRPKLELGRGALLWGAGPAARCAIA